MGYNHNRCLQQISGMLLIDCLISVAPALAYYSQYQLIRQTQSVGSFSIDICAILIFANVMRVFFWFTTGYAPNLLFQSFLVIGIGFALLELCVRVGYRPKGEPQGCWRWDHLRKFGVCVGVFTAGLAALTLICEWLGVRHYGGVLGFVALLVEAMLGIPQFMHNQRTRSVQGLSVFMIGTWFVGDFLKTLYFVLKAQPVQFIVSGSFQLAIDTLILIQVMAFADNTKYETVEQEYEIEHPMPRVK